MATLHLAAQPLTRDAFKPFGDVISTEGARHFSINDGAIERFHDLASVDVGDKAQGRTLISLASCNEPTSLPYDVPLLERHPLGSQAFIPLDDTPLLVVVAPPGDAVEAVDLRAFVSDGAQGVNYRRGVWHMPMISFRAGQRMLIVDREGPGQNCDEFRFERDTIVVDA